MRFERRDGYSLDEFEENCTMTFGEWAPAAGTAAASRPPNHHFCWHNLAHEASYEVLDWHRADRHKCETWGPTTVYTRWFHLVALVIQPAPLAAE